MTPVFAATMPSVEGVATGERGVRAGNRQHAKDERGRPVPVADRYPDGAGRD